MYIYIILWTIVFIIPTYIYIRMDFTQTTINRRSSCGAQHTCLRPPKRIDLQSLTTGTSQKEHETAQDVFILYGYNIPNNMYEVTT